MVEGFPRGGYGVSVLRTWPKDRLREGFHGPALRLSLAARTKGIYC